MSLASKMATRLLIREEFNESQLEKSDRPVCFRGWWKAEGKTSALFHILDLQIMPQIPVQMFITPPSMY